MRVWAKILMAAGYVRVNVELFLTLYLPPPHPKKTIREELL
jgi:hypothetical protein